MGLEQLSPEYQAQYEALLPEIERAVRSKNNARGMFYSGQAGDEEVRAKADLLAKLAGESASTRATASENEKNRQTERDLHAEAIRANKSQTALNLIGTGVGSAAGLAMLAGKSGATNILPMADGRIFSIDAAGNAKLIKLPGGPAAASGGVSVPEFLARPGAGDPMAGTLSAANPGSYAATAEGAGAAPSMWKNATGAGWGGAALAAGGGLAGLGLSNLISGRSSTGQSVGAGLGGLGGAAAYLKYGGGNPYLMGLAGLGGALGGGLLGNLFKH